EKVLPKEAILKLNSGGHTAKIKKNILVTKSGDIISASDDKTIRVWDSKTGKERRKILGKIGAGPEGLIFAIALSPNEKFLAVGGYFENDEIRIYSYQTGKLIKILKSHKNVVYDLAFSENGDYLLSGSGDKTAKLWSSESWNLEKTISFHSDAVYGVKFFKNRTVTASHDNRIAIHSLNGELLKSYTHSHKLMYLATNSENIATCGVGNQILIFDKNLNLMKKIDSETVPVGLNFSPDGKYLIAGTGTSPRNTNIYETRNYSKIKSFKKHSNSTVAVNFLDSSTAISGGGDNNEIYIWNIHNSDSYSFENSIIGTGQTVWSVGLKESWLGFGNKWTGDSHTVGSDIQKAFNLESFRVSTVSKNRKNSYSRISTTYKNWSLYHSAGGSYGFSDAVLNIQKNGVTTAKIVRDATNGYGHNSYGFYGDKIVSAGSNGSLKIYNLNGEEIANLVGHTGEVWSIAIEGDRLVSGSKDQTIRVWDLSKIKNYVPKREIDEDIISEIKKATNWTRQQILENEAFIKEKTGVSIYTIAKSVQPQLSLFIDKNSEWVAWTPENFYTSSEKGKDLIGFHINQGSEHEAFWLPISELSELNRPDLVKKSINGKDLSKYSEKVNIN
ncbi:WD40 repeat-containing protein, partial [Thiovulum sp. ES]